MSYVEIDDYIELHDQTDDNAGWWKICGYCDGCWRPGAPEEHTEGCPVAEVRRLREDVVTLTQERDLWRKHAQAAVSTGVGVANRLADPIRVRGAEAVVAALRELMEGKPFPSKAGHGEV
jgi:hypothetical protein